MFLEAIVGGLFLAATYGLAAFGLAIVFGVLHIINFAHGSLLLLGAYLVVELTQRGVGFWIALPIAIVAIALLGILLEKFLFRRVEQEPIGGMIISIGLIAIIETITTQVWGPDPYYLPRIVDGSMQLNGVTIPYDRIIIIAFAALALGAVQFTISKASWGKLLRATAEDQDAAVLQGVPVRRVKSIAFAVGAGLAALAGIIIGTTVPVEPVLGESILIKAFIIIIIGGAGNLTGTLVGALVLGLTESLSIVYLPTLAATIIPLLVLIVVLLVRPSGLLGRQTARV